MRNIDARRKQQGKKIVKTWSEFNSSKKTIVISAIDFINEETSKYITSGEVILGNGEGCYDFSQIAQRKEVK